MLARAFTVASENHARQGRKVGNDPYIGHLMAVAALIIEHGGSEAQTCAGLLHDTLEDTDLDHQFLLGEFGPEIADIVRDCSDTETNMTREEKVASFRQRKQGYLDALSAKTGRPSVLVALADKVHNAENTLRDVRRMRASDPAAERAFWATFNSKDIDDQRWWYEGLVGTFERLDAGPAAGPLVERMRAAVTGIFAPTG